MLRAITGELSVAEAWRMVEEKRRAAVQASFAYTEAILNGEAASALRAYFGVYRRAVESNRKRLSIRRGDGRGCDRTRASVEFFSIRDLI